MRKIRNTKYEIRNKYEERNPKVPNNHRRVLNFVFRSFGFVSDFELRISYFLLPVFLLVSLLLAPAPCRAQTKDSPGVPDARQSGGEPDGIVQVANLVYAGTKSSRCFADHFLIKAEKESAISTSRRFHAVKLGSQDIYEFPLLIMTGEGIFQLSDQERENLRRYVERGGLLLASAGCSSSEWDRSFRREMATVFTKNPLEPIDMSHPMFHTVYEIKEVKARHGTPRPLVGVSIGGRLGVVYSPDGLNDTAHTHGCCCCGGNELANAVDINVNILAYALTY
jgi:hypothetical protein